jgi:hypothetical protein
VLQRNSSGCPYGQNDYLSPGEFWQLQLRAKRETNRFENLRTRPSAQSESLVLVGRDGFTLLDVARKAEIRHEHARLARHIRPKVARITSQNQRLSRDLVHMWDGFFRSWSTRPDSNWRLTTDHSLNGHPFVLAARSRLPLPLARRCSPGFHRGILIGAVISGRFGQ